MIDENYDYKDCGDTKNISAFSFIYQVAFKT